MIAAITFFSTLHPLLVPPNLSSLRPHLLAIDVRGRVIGPCFPFALRRSKSDRFDRFFLLLLLRSPRSPRANGSTRLRRSAGADNRSGVRRKEGREREGEGRRRRSGADHFSMPKTPPREKKKESAEEEREKSRSR